MSGGVFVGKGMTVGPPAGGLTLSMGSDGKNLGKPIAARRLRCRARMGGHRREAPGRCPGGGGRPQRGVGVR